MWSGETFEHRIDFPNIAIYADTFLELKDRKIDRSTDRYLGIYIVKYWLFLNIVTCVSYKWSASVAGLPNLYSVIDG